MLFISQILPVKMLVCQDQSLIIGQFNILCIIFNKYSKSICYLHSILQFKCHLSCISIQKPIFFPQHIYIYREKERFDREGWWFEHFVSWLQVCLSVEGAKNVSWPWLSPLRGWGILTMAFTGKFVYMANHFILLWLNPFDLRVDREGWWFEHSVS